MLDAVGVVNVQVEGEGVEERELLVLDAVGVIIVRMGGERWWVPVLLSKRARSWKSCVS